MALLSLRVTWAGNWLSLLLDGQFRQVGLNRSQGSILLVLRLETNSSGQDAAASFTNRALAGYVGLSRTGVATQLAALVDAKLVERLLGDKQTGALANSAHDGRVPLYRLTERGITVADSLTRSLSVLDDAVKSLLTRKMAVDIRAATGRLCADFAKMPDASDLDAVELYARRLRAGQHGRGRRDGVRDFAV